MPSHPPTTRVFRITSCLALAGLLAGCADQATDPAGSIDAPALKVSAGNNGPSANGHTSLTIADGLQTLAFHARENRDGSVTGSMQVKSRGQDVTLHGNIDCLTVDGNRAYMNGFITMVNEDNPFGFEEGDRFWFGVEDNGEGNGSVDRWTDVFPVGAFTGCTDIGVGYVDNEAGNVQVKGGGAGGGE